ncbi:hypothetical protein FJ250_00190 [bacterium]|nr:hypothetical protein [bacterium]
MTASRPAAALLAAGLAAWLAGCTSDLPNRVGSGLVDDDLDQSLIQLLAADVTTCRPLAVQDPAVPVHRQQVLYLGEQEGTRSRILANYDFADIGDETHPHTLFTAANIRSVKLSLTKLSHYGDLTRITAGGDTVALDLYYEIRQLTAPFDSTLYAGYPGALPPTGTTILNQDANVPTPGNEPFLRLFESDFLAWVDAGAVVGLEISLGAASDRALVGYAARELLRYSELDDVAVGTVVAPNFVVEFEDNSIVNFLLPPVADTSTFHEVGAPPAGATDGILLRTCLRSYPAFDFDFSALPDDVLINRAVLRLTNDRDVAFGNDEAVVVAEIDSTKLAAAAALPLAEMTAACYVITGQASLDPTVSRHLEFDVTTLVQRLVNDVYAGPRAIVLAAGEDAFPNYDLAAVDPDFYFTEFRFLGTAAADSLRPRLQITYSRRSERLGGAE